MRNEPVYIPVIMHTNSFLSSNLLSSASFDCDSAYDSRSDSENSESLSDVSGLEAATGQQGTCRAIQCKWVDCGKTFSFLDDLAAHVTSFHANSGPGGLFFCGWEGCNRGDRGFNARYKMLVHVRTHTNEKPHRCFQCDKSFSRAENLKIHARSHTGEKPYVCPVPGCGKAYSNSSDRFKHTRTHSEDKPYVCKVPGCGKRYTDPSSLRKHVKTYRHFPAAPVAEDAPVSKDESSQIVLDEELDHEQIVPEAEKNLPSMVSTDPSNYYSAEGERHMNLQMLRKWFCSEQWYPEEGERFCTSCCRDFQEQDGPLDLTVNK